MSEATENALIRDETPVYDPDARNRFEYVVHENGQQFDTAQVFEPLSDDRYLQWLNEFRIRGNESHVDEQSSEASLKLSRELVCEIGNIEVPEGYDWRDLPSYKERIDILNQFLAVAAFDVDDEAPSGGKRTPHAERTQTVLTEAWFNGQILQQRHVMREKNLELEKKYARIQGKRFKPETTRGLRGKPKIEFVPQDRKIGEMYDEMQVSASGFAGDFIPLRFKTAVIHHIFAAKFEAAEKK
ncbi:MAG: hypothetical protein JO314_11840 [Acidobacteria bacterium]|nr:hypothetical protein [Acidobacteriota bacterium]